MRPMYTNKHMPAVAKNPAKQFLQSFPSDPPVVREGLLHLSETAGLESKALCKKLGIG